jgi:hypothetical protein
MGNNTFYSVLRSSMLSWNVAEIMFYNNGMYAMEVLSVKQNGNESVSLRGTGKYLWGHFNRYVNIYITLYI